MRARRMVKYILPVLLLLLFASGCTADQTPTPSPEPTATTAAPGGPPAHSGAELREFVERVVAFTGDEPSITLGRVPDGFDVPMPPEATVIGSLTSPDRQGGMVILDVPGSPGEALSAIASDLEAAGWERHGHRPSGGFQPSEPVSATFCKGDEKSVSVSARKHGPEELADVRLMLGPGVRCNVPDPRRSRPSSLLPEMRPPDGSEQIPVSQGGGGGTGLATRGHAQMGALVGTDLAATSLEEHYRGQLLEQGWELLTMGADQGAAWSFWRVTDEEGQHWAASLAVTNVGDMEDFRAAWIQIAQTD